MEKNSKASILVVDDDSVIAEMVYTALLEWGFDAFISTSGEDALQLIKTTSVDLVLLDLILPGLNGVAVARSMREFFTEDNFVPIILISAYDHSESKIAGLAWADDYVTKPFIWDELRAKIQALLRLRLLQQQQVALKLQYQNLYENAPYIYVTLDESFVITDCNRMFCKKTGRAQKTEILGKEIWPFFEEAEQVYLKKILTNPRIPVHALLCSMIVTGTPQSSRHDVFKVLLDAVWIEEPDHRYSLVLILQDITKNLQLEEQQKVARRQLYQSARLASVGTLAAGVAHEINNPLTAILGFSSALLDRIKLNETITQQELGQYIPIIYSEALRCKDIISNLSKFAAPQEPQIQPCSLKECVADAVVLVKSLANKKKMSIVSRIGVDCRVLADFQNLKQVVINIVNNAIDFSPVGSTVEISEIAMIVSAVVKICIKDSGAGIPAENLPKVYDPFFTTKEVGQGTGFGLSICYRIMEECNGTIEIQSEVGIGTSVFLEMLRA